MATYGWGLAGACPEHLREVREHSGHFAAAAIRHWLSDGSWMRFLICWLSRFPLLEYLHQGNQDISLTLQVPDVSNLPVAGRVCKARPAWFRVFIVSCPVGFSELAARGNSLRTSQISNPSLRNLDHLSGSLLHCYIHCYPDKKEFWLRP